MTNVEVPRRLKGRPVDARGFLVPFFVAWMQDGKQTRDGVGEPDHRIVDPEKWAACVNHERCWLCGQPLGTRKAFVIGPMCAVSRTTSEPGSHRDCAEYALKVCPFLTRPRMRRNQSEYGTEVREAAGVPLDRNPGLSVLWIAQRAKVFKPNPAHGNAGYLLKLAEPMEVEWWREGRKATRTEAEEAVTTGLPALEEIARAEGSAAVRELAVMVERVRAFYPVPEP